MSYPDFPADCPHRTDCHCSPSSPYEPGVTVNEYRRILTQFPAYSRVCVARCYQREVATVLRLHPNHRSHLRRLPPLRVGPPASGVTDFRGVTGGVYKARERIHPGVADPGLLATPTSRSRVADCDPN